MIAPLRTLIMLMIGVLLGACAAAGSPAPTSALTRYYGSGVIVEETRPVDTFSRVQIASRCAWLPMTTCCLT